MMLFDYGLKDNLIVNKKGRPWRGVIIALLLLAIAVALYIILSSKRPSSATEEEIAIEEQSEVVPEKPVSLEPEKGMVATMLALADKGDLVKSRDVGLRILSESHDESALKETEEHLGKVNISLVETPLAMPEKVDYLVKGGDSLERIARVHGTTVELIKKSNGLQRDVIHSGDVLRVFAGKFAMTVSKSRNDLVLTMDDQFFKRYRVGSGKHGTTPTGTFRIDDKISEPPWWRDDKVLPFGDPENVLGTRWMSITAVDDTPKVRGYGIHGTWEDETIGQQSSQGCIRLLNADVEELYMLLPVGTRVLIVE